MTSEQKKRLSQTFVVNRMYMLFHHYKGQYSEMSRTEKRLFHINAFFTKISLIFFHMYEKKNKGRLDCDSKDGI